MALKIVWSDSWFVKSEKEMKNKTLSHARWLVARTSRNVSTERNYSKIRLKKVNKMLWNYVTTLESKIDFELHCSTL